MKTTYCTLFIILTMLPQQTIAAHCTGDQIERMINAGFSRAEILQLCGGEVSPPPAASSNATPVDFPQGSRLVYKANFSQWPAIKNKRGYVRPEADHYAMQATSNAWIGPNGYLPIRQLYGDFIVDVSFRVVEKENCSINIKLSDDGQNYSQFDFFFDIWQSSIPTFSVYENWVEKDFYVNIKRRYAERMTVPKHLASIDWSQINTLSIKRNGKELSYLLNGHVLELFNAPHLNIRKMGLALAFRSKVYIMAVKARVPL